MNQAAKIQKLIAGVDEAGRGPLAGPVVAGAVILTHPHSIPGLADSKQLSPKRREELFRAIRCSARAWAVGLATVAEIEQFNILQASLLAMQRAIGRLRIQPQLILVDGLIAPYFTYPTYTIISGDALDNSISAASIVAKVSRDRLMLRLHRKYPLYGFDRHKGYATPAHIKALSIHGVSPVHRKTFAPVSELISG